MTRRIVFSARADHQIDELYDYIEKQSGPIRAESFVTRIVDFCTSLEPFPERGTRRDDVLPGLRTIGYRRRVTVAFVVEPDAVVIVGIYYGGRDYEADLRFASTRSR